MVVSTEDIQRAVAILDSGGLVAFPTETVYGLGADAENDVAVRRIYQVKGRPEDHPVIVHLGPKPDLNYWVKNIPNVAYALIDRFWPGPLTLILKRAEHISAMVSGGQDSLGVRCPSHPVAQNLLNLFKQGRGGIAAPSANKFGCVSPTTAQHVRDEFPREPLLNMILEGGQSTIGIESTILDLSRFSTHGAVLLRPGQVSTLDLAEVLGFDPAPSDQNSPRASGTLASHYAPRTSAFLLDSEELIEILIQEFSKGKKIALMRYSNFSIPNGVIQVIMHTVPNAYAHDLYAVLRKLDGADVDLILIEAPPRNAEWQGVNDRLCRAAARF